MKKLVCVFLMLTCILAMSVSALAAGGTISLTGGEAKVGETVTVNVNVVNNPGVAGLEIDNVVYDSSILEWTGLEWGFDGDLEGSVGSELTWWGTTDGSNLTGDFCFAKLTFKVLDIPADGKTSVSVVVDQTNTFNEDLNDVVFGVSAATISVGHECSFVENADADCLAEAATCAAPATYYKSCSICGKKSTETFTSGDKDMTKHVGGTETEVGKKAASCTAEGYTGDTVCASCETVLTKGETIAKLAHTGGTATCVKGAICDTCGKEYGEKDANNHADLVTEGKKDPTCTEVGSTGTGKCNACGVELDAAEEIPALGHKGGEATCIAAAVCDTCGKEYGEKDPANHAELTYVEAVEATCMEEGVVAHYECVCGECYLDEAATQVCENHVIPVDPEAHRVTGGMMAEDGQHWEVCDNGCSEEWNRADCTFDDNVYYYDNEQHWIVCDVCGMTESGEREDHVFGEWYVDQAATATETGVKLRECEVCGCVEDATIPATGATSPKTGDEANIALWAIVFLAAGTGALVLSRKKEY